MRKRICLLFLSVSILLTACANTAETKDPYLSDDELEYLAGEIQNLHDLAEGMWFDGMYIAFCDIDLDDIPELFYGYFTLTSSQQTVWYHAYSLSQHMSLEVLHTGDWHTIYEDRDTEVFIAAPRETLFNRQYYVDEVGKVFFQTHIIKGPVVAPYLQVNTVWCDEQGWVVDCTYYEIDDYELPEVEPHPLLEIIHPIDIKDIQGSIKVCYDEYLANR